MIPLHWKPGDTCDFRGILAEVVHVTRGDDLVIRIPGAGIRVVSRHAVELPPLPAETWTECAWDQVDGWKEGSHGLGEAR